MGKMLIFVGKRFSLNCNHLAVVVIFLYSQVFEVINRKFSCSVHTTVDGLVQLKTYLPIEMYGKHA